MYSKFTPSMTGLVLCLVLKKIIIIIIIIINNNNNNNSIIITNVVNLTPVLKHITNGYKLYYMQPSMFTKRRDCCLA